MVLYSALRVVCRTFLSSTIYLRGQLRQSVHSSDTEVTLTAKPAEVVDMTTEMIWCLMYVAVAVAVASVHHST